MFLRVLCALCGSCLSVVCLTAIKPDVLQSTRAVPAHGAGIVAPNSLFFGRQGRLIATPGLYEFDVP